MPHKKEHTKLCSIIRDCDHSYYIKNYPKIPDHEYDELRKRLLKLEEEFPELVTPSSPSQTVGFKVANHFCKATHDFPMLSLKDIFSVDELVTWIKGLPHGTVITHDLKLDGASLDLIYINGKLHQAITRGDGIVGEDVTLNALEIKNVPITFKTSTPPTRCVVRGEVVTTHETFEKINGELAKEGRRLYVNTRACASGSIRTKDPLETRYKEPTFIAYSIDSEELDKENWSAGREVLKEFGFDVVDVEINPYSIDTKYWDDIVHNKAMIRSQLPYDIDGIVFKVNDYNLREDIGYNSRSPKWAVAYKFPASEGISELVEVVGQIGRTGRITPVAKIKPVFVHGTTITSVTLHNYDEIERLGLYIGAKVVVKRAGDVIPKITEVLPSDDHDGGSRLITSPQHCPCCYGRIYVIENYKSKCKEHYCSNSNCPDRIKAHMEYAVSRDVFNIKGLGTETIDNLYKSIGCDPLGVFKILYLNKEEFVRYGNVSPKIAEKLELEVTTLRNNLPLDRLIMALGISNVAKGTSSRLAMHYGSLDAISNATIEDLMKVDDIGEVTATSIFEFFDSIRLKSTTNLDDYLGTGLTIVAPNKNEGIYNNKTIVISGTLFGKYNRKEIHNYYKARGAKITSNVSNVTDYVLLGTKASPAKMVAAVELKKPYYIFDNNGDYKSENIVNCILPSDI